MDTTKYDLSRLNREELFQLRSIQRKMQDENAAQAWPRHVGAPVEYTRLTLDELLRLEDLHYKMAGQVNPHKRTPVYVCVIGSEFTSDSGVAAASQPAPEPVGVSVPLPGTHACTAAIAPAPAPANPAAAATPTPAKLKLPSDSVLSAARQLDSLMRHGV